MTKLAPYWKAAVAFVAPGAVALVAAVQDASAGASSITTAEWVSAGAACIITSAAVYSTPNASPPRGD